MLYSKSPLSIQAPCSFSTTPIMVICVSSPSYNTLPSADSFGQVASANAFDRQAYTFSPPEAARLRAGIAAIPFGETRTYGAVADATGSIARAVGQACKTNAFPIIIPCHRVTSAAGPEYYSAGDGPRTKTWLLDYEYAQLPLEKRTRLI